MNILEITGTITISITTIVLLYKLYRFFFVCSWSSCPNDHDAMERYGRKRCDKCLKEL